MAEGTTVAAFEWGEGLLVSDDPDEYALHKGPWDKPREVEEGYHLMRRAVGPWMMVPNSD